MTQRSTSEQQLQQGACELSIHLSPPQIDQLICYIKQLHQWNQSYNLSGIKTLSDMVTLHLLDSLTLAPYLAGNTIADVGSGAGLPGIPLAIAMPDKQFTLIECKQKKTAFLKHVVFKLQLKNVSVVKKRLNRYQPSHCFDTIVCRAFSCYRDFIKQTQHLCCKDGQFIAMKGQEALTKKEAAHLPVTIHPVSVPGLAAKRHLMILNLSLHPLEECAWEKL